MNKPRALPLIFFLFVISSSGFSATAAAQNKPDLKITDFIISEKSTGRMEISFFLKNTGLAVKNKMFMVRLSHRTGPTDAWIPLVDWTVSNIGTNESLRYVKTLDLGRTINIFFKVDADVDNAIAEVDERNNSFQTMTNLAGAMKSDSAQAGQAGFAAQHEVTVGAARMEIPLKASPAAIQIVESDMIRAMPRQIATDEALKLVPGVKADNETNGEQVHLSIRGQGMLSERGIRGIKVLLDGIPLNDPLGLAPDLYDVDWAAVKRVEVLRGAASSLYGGGAWGGILNILTEDGGPSPIGGSAFITGGSNAFYKVIASIGGTLGSGNYRISGSKTAGDGYRIHTAFDSDNLYGKFKFALSPSVQLAAILAYTNFWNENIEGLNLARITSKDDPKKADAAIAFNEYQKTQRFTGGLSGNIALASNQTINFCAHYRSTEWTESLPSAVKRRQYDTPGFQFQYNIRMESGNVKNHLSVGADINGQTIDECRRLNMGKAGESPDCVSDQGITQKGTAFYLFDRLELGPQWGALLNLRHDEIDNELTDNLGAGGINLSGAAKFTKDTARIGITFNPIERFGLYASWGLGFMPPAAEELAKNPDKIGGFNMHLAPASSNGVEAGARGDIGGNLIYDLAVFYLHTDKDIGYFRTPLRPLETFYANMGASNRYGIEAYAAWSPIKRLLFRTAYTFSDFKCASVKTVTGEQYSGTYLPYSPQHRLYLDFESSLTPALKLGVSLEGMSRFYLDAANKIWDDGHMLLHTRFSYRPNIFKKQMELLLWGRNILGKEYHVFTGPDPDGNSYQPAARQEFFIGLRIVF